MRGSKTLKIVVDGYGSYLGRENGSLIIRNKECEEKRYPLFENEIGEIQVKSGNTISSGALATCGFWGINVLIVTQKGHAVAVLKSLDDDSHVKTRIAQYESLKTDKCLEVAKSIVLAKMEGHNQVLKKYGLRRLDYSHFERVKTIEEPDIIRLRQKLTQIEARAAMLYFCEIYKLFPELIRPIRRSTFKAYDGINNLFNLSYEMLKWKVHIALLKAKLEPYLGFLHSMQHGKPSLVCDFEELYRYLIDDFVIQYCRDLKKRDFIFKTEKHSDKKGKREYLNDFKTRRFTEKLNEYFKNAIIIPRIKIGAKQEIETLISEEALLFAKYLREEKTHWIPRIAELR